MNVITKYVFDPDGKLYRESTNRAEIQITDEIAKAMCADVAMTTRAAFEMENVVHVGMSIDARNDIWWTLRLPHLHIRCPWILHERTWIPALDSLDDPVTDMVWYPPEGMTLALMCCTQYRHASNGARKTGYVYLFAMTRDGISWRLPLGNIYDDCRICMGDENFIAPTHRQCVQMILNQFTNSTWNSDLWTSRNRTQAMFRFRPLDQGFEQLPPPNDWTSQCSRVGNVITDRMVL